jgi:hypothetical protein
MGKQKKRVSSGSSCVRLGYNRDRSPVVVLGLRLHVEL